MAQADLKDLVRRAPFSFIGTVEHLGAAMSRDLPVDDRTAVARVELVLNAPEAFHQLEGHRVTIQLSASDDPPATGDPTDETTRATRSDAGSETVS